MPRLRNREVNSACVFSDTLYTFLDGFSRQERARGLSIENSLRAVSLKADENNFSSRAIFRREGGENENSREGGKISRENRSKSSSTLAVATGIFTDIPSPVLEVAVT